MQETTTDKQPTVKDNIKALYRSIKNKTQVIQAIADACGRKPNTVKTHWVSDAAFWSYPEECEGKIVEVLQKAVKNQE